MKKVHCKKLETSGIKERNLKMDPTMFGRTKFERVVLMEFLDERFHLEVGRRFP